MIDTFIILCAILILFILIFSQRMQFAYYITILTLRNLRAKASIELKNQLSTLSSRKRDDLIVHLQDLMWNTAKKSSKESKSKEEFIINMMIIINCVFFLVDLSNMKDDEVEILFVEDKKNEQRK